jgi:ATP-dependent RNA helicase DDX54/DBP10
MAKTGSGKSACFIIPMFEKLKKRMDKSTGARALVLTPTRELAIQTFKFIKELGKFHNLKTILVLGGDSMDSQFSAIHDNPDIIVATPGRFLHVCMEMDLKLSSIQYIVFDESDRLFEMGFSQQINEIIRRLPDTKQTVMFSATLPGLLVDFAKAGLVDPVLIRLDVDTKIPDTLELKFIFSRPDERYATLLTILRHFIPPTAQTVIFAATQHHVELISMILNQANITNTYVYSNLDPSARKINTAKFTQNKVNVLVVTDIGEWTFITLSFNLNNSLFNFSRSRNRHSMS